MADFQKEKALVLNYYASLDAAAGDEIAAIMRSRTVGEYFWRGMHPFYEQRGAAAVAEVFWKPLRHSFSSLQRRQDVFMAGANANQEVGGAWVCSMGHLMALFDRDWLGIPPTGKLVFLPYVDFHRVHDGKISETASFCDILSVMQQAGQNPLPLQTGASIIAPGPRTHDGLLFGVQDPSEGDKTLGLINRMLEDLLASNLHSPRDELASTWHSDMTWFGPAGIGATYTLDRYEAQHQRPFSEGLSEIRDLGQHCCLAEGSYGGLFGWASLDMKSSGGFMGLPASDIRTEMRLVDIYRRDGEKLAENWIFIDLLHFLSLQGLDVLGRMKQINRS